MNKTQEAIKLLAEANGMTVVEPETRSAPPYYYYNRLGEGSYRLFNVAGDDIGTLKSEGNARLFCWSRSLLEAAEAVIKNIGYHGSTPRNAIQNLIDVIAKAKGLNDE